MLTDELAAWLATTPDPTEPVTGCLMFVSSASVCELTGITPLVDLECWTCHPMRGVGGCQMFDGGVGGGG